MPTVLALAPLRAPLGQPALLCQSGFCASRARIGDRNVHGPLPPPPSLRLLVRTRFRCRPYRRISDIAMVSPPLPAKGDPPPEPQHAPSPFAAVGAHQHDPHAGGAAAGSGQGFAAPQNGGPQQGGPIPRAPPLPFPQQAPAQLAPFVAYHVGDGSAGQGQQDLRLWQYGVQQQQAVVAPSPFLPGQGLLQPCGHPPLGPGGQQFAAPPWQPNSGDLGPGDASRSGGNRKSAGGNAAKRQDSRKARPRVPDAPPRTYTTCSKCGGWKWHDLIAGPRCGWKGCGARGAA